MDAVERIAGFIRADAGDARRVFKEAMRQPHFADRTPRGQFVALQRHDLGINKHKVRRRADAVAPVQAKKIAALQDQGADLVIAPQLKLDLIIEIGLTATPGAW